MNRSLVCYLLVFTVALCAAVPLAAQDVGTITVEPFASGLDRPVAVRHAGDGSDRVYVVEQAGTIQIVNADGSQGNVFLDLTSDVQFSGGAGDERGLLGLAFHPDYASNGLLFVNFTDNNNQTFVSSFRRSDTDPLMADRQTREDVIQIQQPASNHNGGDVHFGADGYLYIGMGDGGGGGDPFNNGQDGSTLLGSMLRLDVDNVGAGNCGSGTYAIPPDNPFLGDAFVCNETWAIGLRNPYRFSFDSATGDLWMGDVGQNHFEEIDFAQNGTGGQNWGWNECEGAHIYQGSNTNAGTNCLDELPESILPVLEYDHSNGRCSVTGGYRYRGPDSGFQGAYVFGDYCTGEVWYTIGEPSSLTSAPLINLGFGLAGFGTDAAGRIYIATLDGIIRRIETTVVDLIFANGFESG